MRDADVSTHQAEGFQRSVLGNGVRVVTESIPSVRSLSVGVWIRAGSRDERKAESGISHLIEHMVFKGTEHRRTHHIAQRLESVGGYLNAFTAKEYTCFYARVLDEHLARALDTLCDLVLHPSFPERELVKEKEVVLDEMRMYEDVPEDLIFDRFEEIAYRGHSLGRPVLGTPVAIRGVTREQLFGYINARYAPNQIVVAAAGNVHHDAICRFVENAFSKSDRRRGSLRRRSLPPYSQSHLHSARPTQQAHLVMGLRCPGLDNPLRVPLVALNTVLGGGMSSRLNQRIRERYGFCYNIFSFLNLYSDSGDFGVYMGTDPTRVDRARKLITRELDALRQAPLSSRMLSLVKSQVKGSIMLGLENMSNRMMRLGRQELYFEKYFSLDQILEEVDAITAQDVREAAAAVLDIDHLSSVVFTPGAENGGFA
jgi:predicted Zn-dependent peptidase